MNKGVLIALLIVVSVLSCKAQILTLEEFDSHILAGSGVPNGITHLKDVNNLRDAFVGTWTGVYETRYFEFVIVKETVNAISRQDLLKDVIKVYYKITSSDGVIIENTLPLMTGTDPNIPQRLIITGSHIQTGTYILDYLGRDLTCGQEGTIFMAKNPNNSNEMAISLVPFSTVYGGVEECPDGPAAQVMPTGYLFVTKQE